MTATGHFRQTKAANTNAAVGTSFRAMADSINATVNMTHEREGHTATLLSDGRVLIAGGNTNPVNNPSFMVHNTAELFDPVSERFSLLPSTMGVGRTHHCAVMMPDKKVLLIGGSTYYNGTVDKSHVDIFDPATDTFSSVAITGSDLLASGDAKCFLLPDHRVFMFGGIEMPSPSILDTATWTVRSVALDGSAQTYQRDWFTSAQTSDGRVLIAGGLTSKYLGVSTVFAASDVLVFDPAHEEMSVLGHMLQARAFAGMLPMPNGEVEVYGGADWDSNQNNFKITSVERISRTGVATKIGDLPSPRGYFNSVMLQNGRSLHVGGSDAGGISTGTQLIFDETSHASGYTGNMVEARWRYGVTQLATGRVLISGGSSTSGGVSKTAEIFEPEANVYVLMPKSAVALGESVQLTAEYNGAVTWSAKLGTVTSNGLYTAPSTVNTVNEAPPYDEVTATANSGAKATVMITLLLP